MTEMLRYHPNEKTQTKPPIPNPSQPTFPARAAGTGVVFPLTTFTAAIVLNIFPALGRFFVTVLVAEPGRSTVLEVGVESGSLDDDERVVVVGASEEVVEEALVDVAGPDLDLETLFKNGLGRFSSSPRSYFGVNNAAALDPETTLAVDDEDDDEPAPTTGAFELDAIAER
jgi:hypothetical protein